MLLIKSWLSSSPVVSSASILEFLQVASRTRAFSGVFSAVSETMLSLFESESLTSLFSLLTRSHLWKEAEAVLRKALEDGRRVELDPVVHLMKVRLLLVILA